jgi:flagellar protein FliO/FliZ
MLGQLRFVLAAFLLAAPVLATGVEGTRPAYVPPPSAVSSSSIVQIIFSLLLVLAAIVLVAWLLKRMNVAQQGSGNLLKIIGGVSIGQRERIVLVEVKDTWLVVGVGPGQIRTLHTLHKEEFQSTEISTLAPLSSENKFAKLLSSLLRHQPSDRKRNAP